MTRRDRRAKAAQERKLPRYYHAVMRELAGQLEPGKLTHVFVQHDGWCDFLNGRGDCNCSPDISSRPDQVN